MQFFEKPIINLHSLLHTATESQQAEMATNSPAILCTLTPVFAIPPPVQDTSTNCVTLVSLQCLLCQQVLFQLR